MKEGDMVTLVSGKFKLSTSDPNTFTSTTPGRHYYMYQKREPGTLLGFHNCLLFGNGDRIEEKK